MLLKVETSNRLFIIRLAYSITVISGSQDGEYDENSLLVYNSVWSRRSRQKIQRCMRSYIPEGCDDAEMGEGEQSGRHPLSCRKKFIIPLNTSGRAPNGGFKTIKELETQ
jgi:hypothetical protein